jgi:hypothetical protein
MERLVQSSSLVSEEECAEHSHQHINEEDCTKRSDQHIFQEDCTKRSYQLINETVVFIDKLMERLVQLSSLIS